MNPPTSITVSLITPFTFSLIPLPFLPTLILMQSPEGHLIRLRYLHRKLPEWLPHPRQPQMGYSSAEISAPRHLGGGQPEALGHLMC